MSSVTAVREMVELEKLCRSTELTEKLQQAGIQPANARKLVERALSGSVKRLSLRLPHNEQILYHDSIQLSESWGKLLFILRSSKSAYGYALQSLLARGGAMPQSLFPVFSGSPIAMKNRLCSEAVLSNLIQDGIVKTVDVAGEGSYVVIGPDIRPPIWSRIKAVLMVEMITIQALKQWAQNLGLISYNSINIRGDASTDFGNYAWDLKGPSYLYPFANLSSVGLEPGFVVADVLLDYPLEPEDVLYFATKCSTLRANRLTRPFLSILIADRFTGPAHQLGKQKGLMLTTSAQLFGDEVGESLQALTQTLTKAVQSQPDDLSTLIQKLHKIEGAANNLRGPLFEMLVGRCISKVNGGHVALGQLAVATDGNTADIDVFLEHPQFLLFIECKGKSPQAQVSEKEVQDWVERQVPRIRNWARSQHHLGSKPLKFSFWTSGKFHPNAVEYLEKRSGTFAYELSWKNGEEVFGEVRSAGETRLVKIYEEHFRNHPLA